MHRQPSYDEPFGWWGPAWNTPEPRGLPELVRQGVLTVELGAVLAELVAQRASTVVAAGPSGAGKTTLLTALLDALPPGTRRVYVRGCYEPFDFLDTMDPRATALLVNEISGHLPIYLWGPGIRRVLAAARDGYQIAATAHAESVVEFVHGLTGYPLRIPAAELTAIDLVVLLDAWRTPDGVRRAVRSAVTLSTPTGPDRIEPVTVADWNPSTNHADVDFGAARALASRLGGDPSRLAEAVMTRARLLWESLHTADCGPPPG